MASITMPGVRFNVAADPGDSLHIMQAGKFSRPTSVPGTVVRGAGGRVRVLRRAGSDRSWALSFPALTRTEVRWLEGRIGQVVQVRSGRGERMFGAFLAVEVAEQVGPGELASVSLTVSELTFSEAV